MSEEDILQIANDISEDMLSKRVSKKQLVQVIRYFQNQSDKNWDKFVRLRGEMALAHLKLLMEHPQ